MSIKHLAKPVQDHLLKREVFVPAVIIHIGQMELELKERVRSYSLIVFAKRNEEYILERFSK